MSHAFPWLPFGIEVPGGATIGRLDSDGPGYQVVQAQESGTYVLLTQTTTEVAEKLREVAPDDAHCERIGVFQFGDIEYLAITFSEEFRPIRVSDIPKQPRPLSAKELLALAQAVHEMDKRSPDSSLSDTLYLPEYGACVSVNTSTAPEDRTALAVSLLTSGIEDPGLSISQIRAINRWVTAEEITRFFNLFGVRGQGDDADRQQKVRAPSEFSLVGRPSLEEFFREYVIDHYWRKDKYDALGVKPPGGILLYGPPGTGKSFAVRKLAEFLEWPLFEINMGQIGSPYIHQTSVVIRQLFESAFEKAPSYILIDEIDSIVGDRDSVGQDHKVEEISEFLRLIELASERGVIVVATTNRKDAIDSAIKRRGRFDHIIEVGYPATEEITSVLEDLFSERPHVGGLNLEAIAAKLSGRPMSDIAWVVNEAARFTVKSQKDQIDDICLFQAISRLPNT